MDEDVFGPFFANHPKFNPKLAEGFAHNQLKHAPDYVDQKFRQVEQGGSFPPALKYLGYEVCTPEKSYQILSSVRMRQKHYYDITRSDIFPVSFKFSWHGEALSQDVNIFLPYTRPGGWLTLNDAQYHIAPVLSDIAISVAGDGLFVRLKMPLRIYRIHHQIMVNGVREFANIPWSRVHNNTSKSTKTSLAHYLFVKHGLIGAFKVYANCDVEVGNVDTINKNTHPETDWLICKTAVSPYSTKGNTRVVNRRTDVRIAIRREDWSDLTSGLMGGFFYLADKFPEQVMLDKELDNPAIWKLLLGIILYGSGAPLVKIIHNMDTHIESVDTYLTETSQRWLMMEDVHVNDAYELFAVIINTYSRRISASSDKISTMYGKRLVVLHYVLYDIIAGINSAVFDMQNAGLATLSEKDVCRIFNNRIKMLTILKLKDQEHKEVSSIGSSTDSLIYKLSMQNLLQTNASRKITSKDLEVTFDESSAQHVSVAEFGNPNVNPEKEPTGRQRTNLYADCDDQGVLIRSDRFYDITHATQERIKR